MSRGLDGGALIPVIGRRDAEEEGVKIAVAGSEVVMVCVLVRSSKLGLEVETSCAR
jgi:hypothetical protein